MARKGGRGGRSKAAVEAEKARGAQRQIAATRSGRAEPEQTDFSPSEKTPRDLGVGASATSITNVSADPRRRRPRTTLRSTGNVADEGILADTAVEESPEDRSRRMSEVTKEIEKSLGAKDVEMAAAAEALKNKPSAPATSLRPTSDIPEAANWETPIRNRGIRILHNAPFVCASCKLPSTHSGGVHISNQPACTICTDQGRPNITPHQNL